MAGARWRPTQVAIANWLERSAFEARHLILIGASAGWMMSTGFLARFERVTAIDIDPLAAPLFALRHGLRLRASGVRLCWLRLDALTGMDEVLSRWPDAALLFDNVLGQQIYRYADPDAVEAALGGLAARLSGREWASVHDWLSGPASPPVPGAVLAAAPRIALAERDGFRLGDRLLDADAAAQSLLSVLGGRGQWQDHRSAGVFPPGTEVTLIPWEFRPGKWHWLQAGKVAAVRSDAGRRFETGAVPAGPARGPNVPDPLGRASQSSRS